MDQTTEQLVTYTAEFSDSVLTDLVRRATLNHIMDTVASAIAGYEMEASRITRAVAKKAPDGNGATLFGDGTRVTPELATFANTTAVRITEWNDGMFAMGGGHASEMIPAILAVGEAYHSSPEEVFLAIVLAYEDLGALGNTYYRRKMHWGIGINMAPAAALAIGKLIGLNNDQLSWALAHSLLTVPLSADHGQRSTMSKGSSVAKAMRRAIFAVDLAEAGMVAAPEPFEGHGGFWEMISGPFELSLPAMANGPMVIEMAYIKRYPSEAHSQSLLNFILTKVRDWTTAEDLESFDIETYWHATESLGRREKGVWDPQNRPTADHSMPYLLSRALVDGELTLHSSFTPERIADPKLRPIMEKFSIRENEEITENYRPAGMEIMGNNLYRVTLRKKSGEEWREDVTFPKGHYHNQMTVEDINAKFDDACTGVMGDEKKERIRSAWWDFENASSISELVGLLADFGPKPA